MRDGESLDASAAFCDAMLERKASPPTGARGGFVPTLAARGAVNTAAALPAAAIDAAGRAAGSISGAAEGIVA